MLAVDIGGTKLAAGLVDAEGTLSVWAQTPTAGADGDELLANLTGLIDSVLADGRDRLGPAGPVACGVGCGGPMAAKGEFVSPLNIPQWRDFPLRDRLGHHTGVPTWVDNDVKALALGEGWVGGAVGASNFLAMVVSTGVGGGLVLDGRLLEGRSGNAGHVGHLIVEPTGRVCGCGARGCLEAEVSGRAIHAITGRPPVEADRAVRQRTGRLVGRAGASVANLLDLDLICVAGSVALGFGDDFFEAAQAELDRSSCIEHARGTVIRPAGLGAAGPLIGAGAVAWRGLGRGVGVR